jgi:hypothetical protein
LCLVGPALFDIKYLFTVMEKLGFFSFYYLLLQYYSAQCGMFIHLRFTFRHENSKNTRSQPAIQPGNSESKSSKEIQIEYNPTTAH